MEIQRPFYLDELIRKHGNGFVKIITGLRRCGKSYLLRTIFKNHLLNNGVAPEQIVEIAFDERDNKKFCDSDVFYEFAIFSIRPPKKSISRLTNRYICGIFITHLIFSFIFYCGYKKIKDRYTIVKQLVPSQNLGH